MIEIRDFEEGDRNFIINSWIKCYRKQCLDIRPDVYFLEHHKIIQSLIGRCKIKIATNIEDGNQIYGYILYEPLPVTILHFIFVKQTFRNMGIGKKLITDFEVSNPCIITHHSLNGDSLLKSHIKIFNPYKR